MNTLSNIMVNQDGIEAIGAYALSIWSKRKIVLISDRNTFDVLGTKALQYLGILGFDVHTLLLNEGVHTTSTASLVYDFLTGQEITKSDGIIGLGNEALCQLSGYVSATYLGGVPLIQVPTTLAAQIRLCTRDKVGLINPEAKSLQISQSTPDGILIDTKVIEGLTKTDLVAAQKMLLNLGLSQDYICRSELRKKAQISGYQIDWKEMINKLIVHKNQVVNQKGMGQTVYSILQTSHSRLTASTVYKTR